jgi:hypothetical protein
MSSKWRGKASSLSLLRTRYRRDILSARSCAQTEVVFNLGKTSVVDPDPDLFEGSGSGINSFGSGSGLIPNFSVKKPHFFNQMHKKSENLAIYICTPKICIYIYVNAHIYVHIHTYTYTTHTHTHIYTYVYIYVCVFIYVNAHIYVHIYTYTYTYTVHTHTHTYTHIQYIHTHTYIYKTVCNTKVYSVLLDIYTVVYTIVTYKQ